ncbi:hypothetical protein TEA_006639 [Camellia sinensis var. sinensis]|uniref:RRM domain-containing protein n=1 Tax=Camellia sinensis var. sinensis TaxID=542762 RepID=A0A4S4DQP4_CAMSN|nr:hypothetical protein TEA_006639 [Camellia sinensis var. sinensis]
MSGAMKNYDLNNAIKSCRARAVVSFTFDWHADSLLICSMIGGVEGPDRIFVGDLPYYFTESQIRELLESFGPLRGFDLVKDRETGNSKGYGFCIYEDPAATDVACATLNGLKMGDKTITVRRASTSNELVNTEHDSILAQAQQHIAFQKMALQAGGVSLPGIGVGPIASTETPTKVLCLTEVINVDELMDDGEYEEIVEDIREEGGKFGVLTDVIIPRPAPNGEQVPGVGKVFLEYSDAAACANAKDALSGRKFGGNAVTAVLVPIPCFLESGLNLWNVVCIDVRVEGGLHQFGLDFFGIWFALVRGLLGDQCEACCWEVYWEVRTVCSRIYWIAGQLNTSATFVYAVVNVLLALAFIMAIILRVAVVQGNVFGVVVPYFSGVFALFVLLVGFSPTRRLSLF